jgi:predicted DNA-binding protein (MmcQ/YjbR family)
MHPTTKPSAHTEKQVQVLRDHALAYPDAHEDFPWGHSAFKVRGKAFAFLHADAEGFSMSVKLPESSALALQLPFAEPTGYGLGKSGWVSARFSATDRAPLSMLKSWLEESYSAIAPKKLVKALFLASGARSEPEPTKAKKPIAKKATAKQATAKQATAKKAAAKKPAAKTPKAKKATAKVPAKPASPMTAASKGKSSATKKSVKKKR